MFDHDKLLSSSVIFAGKAGANLSGVIWAASRILNWKENFHTDKHASLLFIVENYDTKIFYNITPLDISSSAKLKFRYSLA